MKYGDKTQCGYFVKSLTNEYKPKIKNDLIRQNISKIWLEHDEDENEDYIFIYFKDEQNVVWNVYDEVPMACTQVPNYKNYLTDDLDRINDWLKEIAYIKGE